ncbi:excisionase [Diaphorobacter sp. HDW4A]|uniref:citrate synthase family protein n=1 Tax=Diaphorobacter sp. HDW4A TaxID=2714924 RepID=UPI0014075C47|nr:citrate synthase family protein [Diaphorobacter sp. HDW4A]QIL79575.1 excisionase [Diaphorobacter sp. HDW4A]
MPASTHDASANSPWISAEEAAAMLGVKRASLYSYVSRGLLRAQRLPQHRGSSYMLSDVSRLVRQRATIRNPAKLAQSALDWGQAVLPSAITRVNDGQFFYRGQNAVALSEEASLETAAALLWRDDGGPSPVVATPESRIGESPPEDLPDAGRALSLWFQAPASLTHSAPASHDQRMRFVHAMCSALLGQPLPAQDDATPIHQRLQHHWHLSDQATDLLRRALVLCADHELNASTFAVRVVASTGASLHASLGAGLAALSGAKHGGMTSLIDRHWDEWHGPAADPQALAPGLQRLLRETQTRQTPSYCAGFGHPLYRQGDPRSLALLAALPPQPDVARLTEAVLRQTGLHPSLDYALVAVQRSLKLPHGAAFLLFALGRTAGWIAHAAEQVQSGQLIRPRANPTGNEEPASATEPTESAAGRVVRFR